MLENAFEENRPPYRVMAFIVSILLMLENAFEVLMGELNGDYYISFNPSYAGKCL